MVGWVKVPLGDMRSLILPGNKEAATSSTAEEELRPSLCVLGEGCRHQCALEGVGRAPSEEWAVCKVSGSVCGTQG